MSQSLKPRFAIDLDEIERQLQSAGSGAQQPAPAPVEAPRAAPAPSVSRNDPLAELARIVGQEDPFGNLLAGDRAPAAQRKGPPTFDELFAPRGEPIRPVHTSDRWSEPSTHQEAARPYADERPYDGPAYDEQAAQPAYDPRYDTEPASAYAAQDNAQQYDSGAYESYEGQAQEAAPRKSRKAALAVASVLGIAALGVGGVVLFGGKGSPIAGEPPLVTATAGPTKVQPQSPGGVEIPNQNKQIYERAAQDTKTRVVNREEQPVDVRQATRVAPPTPTDAVTTGSAAPAANSSLGEPRRVRTISIRPDGTVVPDSAPAAATPSPAPTRTAAATPMVMPVTTPTVPTTPVAAPAQPRPAAPVAAPVTAAPSTPAANTPAPRPAAATPAASTSGASPQAAPAAQPQRVAAVAPAAPAAAATATDAPVSGFSVQLGVAGSEADARKAFQGFQQKFSDLNGQSALIRKAEVNGNTIYRVRVGPMSREEATSLCSKLQGSGCFVAKN
jgi:hypothetical protein